LGSSIVPRLSLSIIHYAFWVIRRFGMKSQMQRIEALSGKDLVVRHYYSPVPDAADFRPGFWEETSALPGLRIDQATCLELLHDVFPQHLGEFRARYPVHKPDEDFAGFHLVNGVYMAVDAHAYYALVREHKPARIIEIGSGMSTRLAVDALAENAREDRAGTLTAIEPHASDFLRAVAGVELIEAKLQAVDLSLFGELRANDILFIDSTHVLREGNDVQLEYLELLPRLRDGVLVHIHDVSLPKRYPRVYFETGMYWNEQYLLQAFLAFNDRFEIIWPGNYMMLHHAEEMSSVFPEIEQMRQVFPSSEPSAFWMKTRAA
jgi:predicted O-methyltransferase YrrM